MTDISTPAYTHIPGPPVSQNVINRPKQQVLSLCPIAHSQLWNSAGVSSQPHMQWKVNPIPVPFSLLQPLPSLQYMSSTFRSTCLLSDTYTQKHSHGNVIRSASPCGYDSVHQLCYSPTRASRRAAGTTGWRKVKVWKSFIVIKRKGMCEWMKASKTVYKILDVIENIQ